MYAGQGRSGGAGFTYAPRAGRKALKRDIKLQFGAEVLSIVLQCTDDEYRPAGRPSEKGSPEEWRVRKEAYLESLRKKTHVAALRVSCADKLHNARAILAHYETEGERLWQRFDVKSKDAQLGYYEGLTVALAERSEVLGDAGLKRLAGQLAATVARDSGRTRQQLQWNDLARGSSLFVSRAMRWPPCRVVAG